MQKTLKDIYSLLIKIKEDNIPLKSTYQKDIPNRKIKRIRPNSNSSQARIICEYLENNTYGIIMILENKSSFSTKQDNESIKQRIKQYNKDTILNKINETLKTEEEFSYDKDEFEDEVYIKFKKDKPYEITKDGDTWVVTGKEIERLFNMTKFTEEEGVLRFGRILRAMGVEETLEKMGAKPGDDVAINDYLFTYKG